MIETEDSIIVHIPKCGGMTLRRHIGGKSICGQHEGIFALSAEQRRKRIHALTREPRQWYQSLFQYCVDTRNPWLEEFGVPCTLNEETFRLFLHRATIDPPETQKLVIPEIRAPFDSFRYMRSRGRGFWSFWHEFLCSDDPQDIRIAADVQFVPCGHKRFFPLARENVSSQLSVNWDREALDCLRVDADVERIVASQTIP